MIVIVHLSDYLQQIVYWKALLIDVQRHVMNAIVDWSAEIE